MTEDENDDGGPMKHTMFSGLRDLASVLGGEARPLSLADHPGMEPGTATIVADEGQTFAENSATVALQRETYIVDLHPDNGADPEIRAEVQCWVSWLDRPIVGDSVPAGYQPGTKDAVLLLAGHARWDWELAASTRQVGDAAKRDATLDAAPGSAVPKADADWSDPSGRPAGN